MYASYTHRRAMEKDHVISVDTEKELFDKIQPPSWLKKI